MIPDEVLGEELSEDDDGGLEALHDAFMAEDEEIDLFFPRDEDDVDEDPVDPAAAAALGPDAFTPPPELPAAPPPEPPPAWVADMAERFPLEVDKDNRPVLPSPKWGVFTVTAIPRTGRYGSYQVACPFHRRGIHTWCKKQCRILGPGDRAAQVASHFIALLS